ncbi:MAG: peptidylprolyl isomerase [Candidatus Delongbacteria bacterium]|nr:peptidylprolyl isomerase [Candidatus Delongbacteria bacterium]
MRWILIALITLAGCLPLPAGETIDRVLAVVDKEIILESDVLEMLQQFATSRNLDLTRDAGQLEAVRLEILNSLIQEKVLLTRARIDSVIVDPGKIDREVNALLADYVRKAGTEENLERIFNLTITQIRRKLRENTRNRLLTSRVTQQYLARIKVSRVDVENFYAVYRDSLPEVPAMLHCGQIFLAIDVSREGREKTRRLAQAVVDSLRSGRSDFAAMAATYSDDTGTRARAGLIGETTRGTMLREYEYAAYNLLPGEVSPPVLTELGYHIIRLEERAGEKLTTSHILFRLTPTATDEQSCLIRADSLVLALRNGADLKKLSHRLSTNPVMRQKSGDLGPLEMSQFAEQLQSVVSNMQPGAVSDPIRMVVDGKDGFVVLKLWKRIPSHAISLNQDWDKLEEFALQFKQQEELQKWIEQLKREIYIEIRPL